ncbi:MAG: hypothetical protein QNJ41_13775 [Xenococcaceae cyanobacterium MO_188.B32]|nr:hypothetical protein [Xenococcaceae cyanobacterium MO_188.B32]
MLSVKLVIFLKAYLQAKTLKYERIIICIKRETLMDRGKIVAIVTGVISLLVAIAYLVIVQVLDFRGEMIPAPVSQLINWTIVLSYSF